MIALSLIVDVDTLIDGMHCAVDTESGTITLIDWKGTNRSGPVGLDDHFACPTVTD